MTITENAVTYSADEARKAAGISYRMLDHWARTGVVRPSAEAGHGSGTRRRYTEADVQLLAAVGELRRNGIELDAIRRELTERGPDGVVAKLLAWKAFS